MSLSMDLTHPLGPEEATVLDAQDTEDRRDAGEPWQDITDQYRSSHESSESVLHAVEDLLLILGESLAARAAREELAGDAAVARRTMRYAKIVHDLYVLAETGAQAQMAAAALELGAPAWLFSGDDGDAWRREIRALADYAAWAGPPSV